MSEGRVNEYSRPHRGRRGIRFKHRCVKEKTFASNSREPQYFIKRLIQKSPNPCHLTFIDANIKMFSGAVHRWSCGSGRGAADRG